MSRRRPRDASSGRTRAGREWAEHVETSRALAGRIVSFANLLGAPVLDAEGKRVGRLDDVIVRWESGVTHPVVSSIVVRVGRALASVTISDVTIEQNRVQLRSSALAVALPRREHDTIALARDLLDHQLVDVAGVQVVRAADVYLSANGGPWHVAGVDVGQWAFWRRVLPRRRTSPLPRRAIDWSDVQAFVPRFFDEVTPYRDTPAASASATGASLQLMRPAAQLHTLRARDVAALLANLSRDQQGQLSSMVDPGTVAEVLADVDPKRLAAALADMDEGQRARIEALLLQGRAGAPGDADAG